MAFHFQSFKTRAITAVLFVAVMLTGLLWNQWSFLFLFTIIHFGCWWEYQRLVGFIDKSYQEIHPLHRYGIMLIGYGLMLWLSDPVYHIGKMSLALMGWSMFWVGLIAFILSELLLTKKLNPRLWAYSFSGLLYISLSWGCMMRLSGSYSVMLLDSYAWMLPLLLIASIWINDTMAYLVGSFIGKTPFSPISPKKTWEGTIGGAIIAIGLITYAGHACLGFPIQALLMVSVTAAIGGTAGDLFESKLKRLAGVKDSGQIMPGHGGFLDRFDSLLFASTLVWIVLRVFSE